MLVSQHPQRFHGLVVVVQRFTHAHQHDIETLAEHAELACEYAHLADDLTGAQIADDPHLACQAKRASHRASDLRG